MSMINDYLSKLKRHYPNTQAVQEQLEELRDTLHIKTEEYQSQGLNYNNAAKAAIDSLGDVTPLLEEVAGNVKNVYVNKLNKNNALFCTLIILGLFLLGWLVFLVVSGMSVASNPFPYSLLAILLSLSVWPAIAWIQFRKDPKKINVIEMPYRKLLKMAFFGWGSISLILFLINIITSTTVIWFMWPMIGVATWPLNIILYHRQLMGGRYDAA